MTWFHGVPLLLIGALIGPAIRAAGVRHLNLSFKKEFTRTNDPKVGNVAVFTCYDKQTNESIGLGHVAFVREKPLVSRSNLSVVILLPMVIQVLFANDILKQAVGMCAVGSEEIGSNA